MFKTIMVAATMLTLGVGAAFADGNVTAQPATVAVPQAAPAQAHPVTRLFPASMSHATSVYELFGYAGVTQGGNN
jgi:sorbitol-specific phosphotransferase system component IIC